VENDPLVSPREPIKVTVNGDDIEIIVDGSATAQAAIFIGWKFVPVIVVESS